MLTLRHLMLLFAHPVKLKPCRLPKILCWKSHQRKLLSPGCPDKRKFPRPSLFRKWMWTKLCQSKEDAGPAAVGTSLKPEEDERNDEAGPSLPSS
jgi:hypothetical protein